MSADELHYKSISELSELFRRKEALPSEVTRAILNRIDKFDGSLHGYAVVLADRRMADPPPSRRNHPGFRSRN